MQGEIQPKRGETLLQGEIKPPNDCSLLDHKFFRFAFLFALQ